MSFKPGMSDEELRKEGYLFGGTSICRGKRCQKMIEWYITPTKAKMPLDPGTHIPHHSTCIDVKRFKKPMDQK